MAKNKKTPADSRSTPRSGDRSRAGPVAESAPFVLTLRDVEAPLPLTESAKPPNDGLVVSDSGFGNGPFVGDDAQAIDAPEPSKPAKPVEETLVVSDSGFQTGPFVGDEVPAIEAPPPIEPAEPAADTLVVSDAERRPKPYLGDPEADRAAQRAARRAQVRRDRTRDESSEEQEVPQVLVLTAGEEACQELCALLRGFGFGVQQMGALPALPAPWPFVAVFVVAPIRGADGGDTIDLCNHVRETSRLPGEKKPVLVLTALQLSATDRVRAGLAGCNEILIGVPARGSVAQLLDARGIALPSDARRS